MLLERVYSGVYNYELRDEIIEKYKQIAKTELK